MPLTNLTHCLSALPPERQSLAADLFMGHAHARTFMRRASRLGDEYDNCVGSAGRRRLLPEFRQQAITC